MALLRALTEAAQARTTYISGTRDDFPLDAWETAYRRRRRDTLGRDLDDTPPQASFSDVPTFTAPTPADDLDWLLARLRTVGVDQTIAIDLDKPALGLPVVRMVVPGLEGPNEEGGNYAPGPRARRLMELGP